MSLEDTLSNMSLYDAKKYFRKAQNAVFNLTEMEGKVREATNNEPWGTSSTLMEQIAQGTFNFREREEVVGMLFKRFTEKTGSEWRQIYKALQLLEYLVKHGSEKFIDDARNSIRIVQMLEDFHYIDSQGRDQGINVRNRAKVMVALLSDDEQLRNERKKARETANKYKGVMGGTGGVVAGVDTSMNPRAGFTKSTAHGISVSADFDSDEEDTDAPPKSLPKLDNVTGYEKFSFTDDEPTSTPAVNSAAATQQPAQDLLGNDDDDDEFADFQTATPVANIGVATATKTPQVGNTNTLDASHFNAPASTAHQFSNVIPAIQQAAQEKKSDPFSSLFATAKDIKDVEPIKPQVMFPTPAVVSTATTAPITDNNTNDDDDDDLFGDLETAQPQQQPTSNNTTTQNEEIDLLSF
ncbi:epsin-3 [Monosporozyma unispora]|nr:Epsin-3, clathrin recruitment and traffic between the Golgi and endosome [Kazachstania unispora]